MRIHLNLSHAFQNKTILSGKLPAYGYSFVPAQVTLHALAAHILSGKAWTPGHFQANRRTNNTFVDSQLLVLDFDEAVSVQRALDNPFIRQYAALIHPTPSSRADAPRSRVIFVLDEPVQGTERWRALAQGLVNHVADLGADPNSCKPAQPYMGSDNVWEPPYIDLGARLPLSIAGGLTLSDALNDYQKSLIRPLERQPIAAAGQRAERYSRAAVERIIGDYLAVPGGVGQRHNAFLTMACDLIAMQKGGWPGLETIEGDIQAVGEQTARSVAEIRDAIAWARENATARALELPAHNRKAAKSSIQTDITFEADYVTDFQAFPRKGVLCIMAGKGQGKTEFAVQCGNAFKDRMKTVWIITPLISLTRAAAKRFDVDYYEALSVPERLQANHLAITLNSIQHYATLNGEKFPAPRLLVLEELRRILEATRSQKLFKRGAAQKVISVLKRLIQQADFVLVTDADLTHIEVDWLKQIRPDVTVAVNTRQRHYGKLMVIPELDSLISQIKQAIADNQGPVYIFSTHKATIETLNEMLEAEYGDSILSIHAGNSTNIRQRSFLENPAQIGQLRALLASPSTMTGLDIQTPVYKTFGIIHASPVDATGALQGIARTRKVAAGTYVWVESSVEPDGAGGWRHKQGRRETRVRAIYDRMRKAAKGTECLCSLDEAGRLDFDGIHKEIAVLHAKIMARRNRSLNDLRGEFIRLAQHNYAVEVAEATAPVGKTASKEMREARQVLKEQKRDWRLTLPPLSPEEHRALSGKGIRRDEDNSALDRWLIEHFYKQAISPELDDFDSGGKGRERVSLFMDVFRRREAHLRQLDIEEHAEGTPKSMLSHHNARQRVIRRLLVAVWGTRQAMNPDTSLTLEHLETAVSQYLTAHGAALALYCDFRPDHSDNPLRILQRILRMLGLGLEERRSRDKEAPKQYRLCRIRWKQMNDLADLRQAGLEREEDERERQAWQVLQKSGNTDSSVRARTALTSTQPPQTPHQYPPGEGWRLLKTNPVTPAPNEARVRLLEMALGGA